MAFTELYPSADTQTIVFVYERENDSCPDFVSKFIPKNRDGSPMDLTFLVSADVSFDNGSGPPFRVNVDKIFNILSHDATGADLRLPGADVENVCGCGVPRGSYTIYMSDNVPNVVIGARGTFSFESTA
jgi:hypothetical protein